jgi:hypothetical protein
MDKIFNLMDPADLAEFIELTKDRPFHAGMTKEEFKVMLDSAYAEKLAYVKKLARIKNDAGEQQ